MGGAKEHLFKFKEDKNRKHTFKNEEDKIRDNSEDRRGSGAKERSKGIR